MTIVEEQMRPLATEVRNSAGSSGSARVIRSDEEAVEVARELAAEFAAEAADRDRERRLPVAELDCFSESGLWAITVPKAYGGAGVSFTTVNKVIATISAADPSIGQIPQNHLGVTDLIRIAGTEEQKRFWFGEILKGRRFGNAFSEAKSKHAGIFNTRIERQADGRCRVNGEKFYCTGALFAHYVPIAATDPDGVVQACHCRPRCAGPRRDRQLVRLRPTDDGERQGADRGRAGRAAGRDRCPLSRTTHPPRMGRSRRSFRLRWTWESPAVLSRTRSASSEPIRGPGSIAVKTTATKTPSRSPRWAT